MTNIKNAYKRWKIVQVARSYVGDPFRHQGRSHEGIDCIGIVIKIAHELGYSDIDYSNYDRNPDTKTILSEMNKHLLKRTDGTFEPGDILVFALPKTCHVGVYTDKGTVIHALSNIGKVVEHRLDDKWREKIRGVYFYKGL